MKKHVLVAYHFARWNVAAGIVSVSWINGTENLSDAYTKGCQRLHGIIYLAIGCIDGNLTIQPTALVKLRGQREIWVTWD